MHWLDIFDKGSDFMPVKYWIWVNPVSSVVQAVSKTSDKPLLLWLWARHWPWPRDQTKFNLYFNQFPDTSHFQKQPFLFLQSSIKNSYESLFCFSTNERKFSGTDWFMEILPPQNIGTHQANVRQQPSHQNKENKSIF